MVPRTKEEARENRSEQDLMSKSERLINLRNVARRSALPRKRNPITVTPSCLIKIFSMNIHLPISFKELLVMREKLNKKNVNSLLCVFCAACNIEAVKELI